MSHLIQSGWLVFIFIFPIFFFIFFELLMLVFGMHDRSKYEITCYALNGSDMSQWRNKIELDCEHFKDISMVLFQTYS